MPTINVLEEWRKAGVWRDEWIVYERGHLIHAGFAANICLWGKECGLISTARLGLSCMVARDLTDAFGGTTTGSAGLDRYTARVVEHIEPLVFDDTALVRVAGFLDSKRVALDSEGYYCRLPEEPPLPSVYLSDLKWQQASLPGYAYWPGGLPWNAEGAQPPQKDRSYHASLASLQLRGVAYPKGIGMHAPARLLYEPKPQYELFVAKAGVDETMLRQQLGRARAGFPSVVFEVFFDGVLAAESPVMRMQQEPWRFQVPIPKGSRLMELVVTDAGDGPREDLANWVNAGFMFQQEKK